VNVSSRTISDSWKRWKATCTTDARRASIRPMEHINRLVRRAAHLTGHELVRRAYYTPIPTDVPRDLWDRESAMPGIVFDYEDQLRLADRLGGHLDGWQPPDGRGMYGAIDARVLYAMIRHLEPRRVVELGSGVSTTIIRQALGRPHEVFDPIPNDRTTADVVRLSATDVPLDVFLSLEADDILFVDTSHTVKTGGDVNRIVLDVLPRLRAGVVVHFHDIFLPYEYPREWIEDKRLYWAEQYLLQAFLIANTQWRVLLALNALARRYPARIASTFHSPNPVAARPGAFWLQRVA
jgi:hypothetical protein